MLHGLAAGTLSLLLLLSAVPAAATSALDPELTADAIYEKVLANRFHSSVQEIAMVSADALGREQPLRIQMLWRRYPEGTGDAKNGVQSRTLVRYLEPADLRGTGYLIVDKRDSPDDQFMYLSSLRRSRRINLRNETVIGTDLSVEDIVPREMDDATYERAPDEVYQDTPCYVVEATPVEDANSQYSRFQLTIEPEHFVPLRTRYWDHAGVEVKELVAPPAKITEIDGVWIPLEARMQHLVDGGYTSMDVVRLTPDPDLPKSLFTQRQLEQRKLRLPKKLTKNAREF
ncbi:MAG: outer membrane lipoprotein-sorting protein [Myxococcota bacterium]